MKLVVVYNSSAGGELSKEHLAERFAANGHVVEEFIVLDDNLTKELAPHVAKGATIAAVGGDGTQSAVANCIIGTGAVLVPLAGGTLNHFVKDLGGEVDINKALERLSSVSIRRIDAVQLNDRVFINNSSLGLYPTSLRVRSKWEDKLGKWPAAVLAAFLTVLRFRVYLVKVNNKTVATPFIFVGNNIYHLDKLGGGERRRLDEGVLSVFIAKATSRWALLKIALLVLFGKASSASEFEFHRLSSLVVKVKTKEQIKLSCDGELKKFSSPVQYRILPKSLRVRI